MKTTLYILPLVIVCILFDNNILPAQCVHVSLYSYFSKLPAPPDFPSHSALASDSPLKFEDCTDLDATESTLGSSLKVPLRSDIFKEDALIPQTGVAFAEEKPEIKQEHDELLAALKEMQAVRTEYQENFRRLEEVYAKHAGAGAAHIIPATRNKIESEQYLLNIYISHMKPALKKVDELLERYHYGDEARSAQTKNVFRGAQQCEALILSDIIERLKLERITISNCARIAQQK